MKRTTLAVLAMLVAGMAFAAPAQAQSFGIFFGDEPSDFEFGDSDFFAPPLAICLSDRQIRQAVADEGFYDIFLNIPDSKHVQVRASRDGMVYLLDFNYCTGRIESAEPLRAAR